MTSPGPRKALAESREPWSIRFCPSERQAITLAARQRGLDPSTFAHDLCLMGLMLVSTPSLMEAFIRHTATLVVTGP